EGRSPLAGVLVAFPARFVRGYVALGTFLEGERLGLLRGLRGLPGFAIVDRVHAVHNEPVGRIPFLAGILQRNQFEVTQAHLPGAAGYHEPENPSLGLTVADLQIQSAAVPVEAGLKIVL